MQRIRGYGEDAPYESTNLILHCITVHHRRHQSRQVRRDVLHDDETRRTATLLRGSPTALYTVSTRDGDDQDGALEIDTGATRRR